MRWSFRALAASPDRNEATSRAVSPGRMLATTEMTPEAPTAIMGSVRESSPDSTENLGPQSLTIWDTWSRLPEASLTPTILAMPDRRATVLGSMFTPVREGTL